ncbi:MAG: hypothetical protein V1809_16705 [Planctomycetota bacterium]
MRKRAQRRMTPFWTSEMGRVVLALLAGMTICLMCRLAIHTYRDAWQEQHPVGVEMP